jgi:hypothetical protein
MDVMSTIVAGHGAAIPELCRNTTRSEAGAVFDGSGAYRYLLWRTWDMSRPAVAFVMLNPSTADAERLDPTIRRCVGFARRWNFGRVLIVNLFGYRSIYPQALSAVDDPVGGQNQEFLRGACSAATLVVAAWGNHGAAQSASGRVRDRIGPANCLGLTNRGEPRHPLYVPYSATLSKLPPRAVAT